MVNLNGTPTEGTGMNLEEFLKAEGFNQAIVAVGVNGKVTRKEEYPSLVLKDGDEVEVFHFMSGG
jgi:thiamine biosynthesis protein ThiS